MDWDLVRSVGSRPVPPKPQLLETCWRFQSKQGPRIVTCGLYRVLAPGIEVRVGYSDEDLLYSTLVADLPAGRERAAALKVTVSRTGGFDELPLP